MPYVMQRNDDRYYTGLGVVKGSAFSDCCWEKEREKAVRYETKEIAIEAAKTLFPNVYYRGKAKAIEVPE